MGVRYRFIVSWISHLPALFFCSALYGQMALDSSAFLFKLDHEVPESPAFSVLDANPTTVMRASAAQEVIVNVAQTLLSGNNLQPGIAVDFNPYFVFGGKMKNIQEYRDDYGKRFLGNAQLSFASTARDEFPDDLFISSGVRFTLFDSKDPLYDDTLIEDIGTALIPVVFDDEKIKSDCEDFFAIGNVSSIESCIEQTKAQQRDAEMATTAYKDKIKRAYADSKKRLRQQTGGAVSAGYAVAGRLRSASFEADSMSTFRHQAWLSAQYDFKNQLSLSTIWMYRYNDMLANNQKDEFIMGAGLRHIGTRTNLLGELTWSSLGGGIRFRGNMEIRIIPYLILFVSAGNELDLMNGMNDKFVVRPGFKWNLSERGIR